MEQHIQIRALQHPDEMNDAVELQKVYWGQDMGDLVPHHMLLSIANYGGHVFGAFIEGRMVGLLIGFLGADISPNDAKSAPQRALVMSKRMVVLPEYRNYKIGERLKLAQRDFAIRHDVPLVTWTFDPLLSRNAYLNLHKLGAIGQKYQSNYFGTGSHHATLSGDRLVANWWVKHVHQTTLGTRDYADAPTLTHVVDSKPLEFTLQSGDALLAEIPADFAGLELKDAGLGQAWRDYVRHVFTTLFTAGYLATDVIRRGERTFYVFTPDDGTFTF